MSSTLACCVLVSALAAACGGTPEPGEGSTLAPTPARDLGPLALLVPSGAKVVVTARPAALMAAPASRTVIDAVFDEVERDAFARRTGIEPAEVEEVVVAEYESGFVIIARGPWPARDVVIATESRMSAVEVRADEPFLRRVGFLGTERRDVSAISEDVVLFTTQMPDVTASILEKVRSGRFVEGQRAALATAELAPLLARHEEAPAALYVPAPLSLPPGLGLSVLLARQRALAAVATSAGPSHVAVGVQLVGEFPPTARENFENLLISIANDDLGAALGMREGLESLSVEVVESAALMGLELRAETLAMGLRTLFGGEIAELLAAPVREP